MLITFFVNLFVNCYVHTTLDGILIHTWKQGSQEDLSVEDQRVWVSGPQLNKFKQIRARGWGSPGEQV